MVKVLANGEKTEAAGIAIEAVPAYNTTPGKEKFHPKGRDNGYVLTMGGKRVYIAGDTEDTAEMRALKGIDIAFLPMNLPYTMSVREGGGRDPAVQTQDRLPLSLPQRRRHEGGPGGAQEARRRATAAWKSAAATGIPNLPSSPAREQQEPARADRRA